MAAALGVTPQYLVNEKEDDTTEAEMKRHTTVKAALTRAVALNTQMRKDLKLIKGYF